MRQLGALPLEDRIAILQHARSADLARLARVPNPSDPATRTILRSQIEVRTADLSREFLKSHQQICNPPRAARRPRASEQPRRNRDCTRGTRGALRAAPAAHAPGARAAGPAAVSAAISGDSGPEIGSRRSIAAQWGPAAAPLPGAEHFRHPRLRRGRASRRRAGVHRALQHNIRTEARGARTRTGERKRPGADVARLGRARRRIERAAACVGLIPPRHGSASGIGFGLPI